MSDLKLVVIILNRDEHLDELLEAFVELDVRGATVIDSVGMGQIISHDIPIFGGLRSLMTGARPYNKTILTVVREDMVESICLAFEHVCGSINEPGTGVVFSLPVDFARGLKKDALA